MFFIVTKTGYAPVAAGYSTITTGYAPAAAGYSTITTG